MSSVSEFLESPLGVWLIWDLALTVLVWIAAFIVDNASLYDPYWNTIPIGAVVYWWVVSADVGSAVLLRQILITLVFTVWTFRLNYNFLTTPHGSAGSLGKGRHREDWRYSRFRVLVKQNAVLYWLIAFFGIMLVPTLIVYAGCLPLYHALVEGSNPIGVLDFLALIVGLGGVVIEGIADLQLKAWFEARKAKLDHVEAVRGEAEPIPELPETADENTDINEFLCYTGLFKSLCRKPNYLGENMVWISFYIFAVASAGFNATLYTIAGPLLMLGLFIGISIPLAEKRQLTRRGAVYAEYMRRVPAKMIPGLGCIGC